MLTGLSFGLPARSKATNTARAPLHQKCPPYCTSGHFRDTPERARRPDPPAGAGVGVDAVLFSCSKRRSATGGSA